MGEYVEHFLGRVRVDYPLVVLDQVNIAELAAYQPAMWQGGLDSFAPTAAGSLYYNLSACPAASFSG